MGKDQSQIIPRYVVRPQGDGAYVVMDTYTCKIECTKAYYGYAMAAADKMNMDFTEAERRNIARACKDFETSK